VAPVDEMDARGGDVVGKRLAGCGAEEFSGSLTRQTIFSVNG
jgi:hypothetical protein